jgi:C_GCAxxG_C_C family probable redox protein
MNKQEAMALARHTFLLDDNKYGCAETSFIVLKHAFGLPCPADSSPAMALNGGIAWQGNFCGAITGAALAVGMFVEQSMNNHIQAKRVTRDILGGLIMDFEREFGSSICRTLINFDIRQPEQHKQFIMQGVWRVSCMSQIEFVVARLCSLPGEPLKCHLNRLQC